MLFISVRRFGTMVLLSILFFYMGCYITLSFTRIDCSTESQNSLAFNRNENDFFKTAEYIVLIISSPSNEAKRDTVRATWGNFVNNIFIENGEIVYRWNHTWTLKNFKHSIVKIYFVMGTSGLNQEMYDKIRNEQKRCKDLLLLDNVEDKYTNLSIKMLHAIYWLSKNIKEMKYVIKCDDDSFVRIDLIVKDLDAFAPSMSAPELSSFITLKDGLQSYKGLYWGYFHGNAKVYLNGKWAEKDWFLCDYYLPYALGGGYVISRSIVDYIANNIEFLSHYNSEDVSMGVWTSSLKGINRVHDIRFDTEWKSRGCNETMLVRHKQTTSDMFFMYKTLVHSHGAKLCKTEDFIRKTYLYDWNVLPSKCCKRT